MAKEKVIKEPKEVKAEDESPVKECPVCKTGLGYKQVGPFQIFCKCKVDQE